MKKRLPFLFAISLFLSGSLFAQTLINGVTYRFNAANTGPLTVTATQLIGANSDNVASAVTNIGFNFWFAGTLYTQFSVSENGLMTLGSTQISGTDVNNNMSSGTTLPKIAAYWDDLKTGSNGYVNYGTYGTSPNRVLCVNWFVAVPKTNATSNAMIQAQLYEASGSIHFVFGATYPPVNSAGYTMGVGAAANDFASITPTGNTFATAAYGTSQNANTMAPGNGSVKRYQFGTDYTAPAFIAPTAIANSFGIQNRTMTSGINDLTPYNGTGVPTTGTLMPRIYYKKTTDLNYVSNPGVFNSGTSIQGSWTFTVDHSLLPGGIVNPGDQIQYFIVAQDQSNAVGHPNISSYPAAGFSATDVNTITTPPTTPSIYVIGSEFSGIKTVGSGGDYPSLTLAGGLFDKINGGQLSGNLTINIISDLSGETGTINLNALNSGVGGPYIVTINPVGNRTINASGPIVLNGTQSTVIDGLNDGFNSLTIISSGGAVSLIGGASNNTITRTTIKGYVSSGGGVVLVNNSTATPCNYNVISYCTITSSNTSFASYQGILYTGTTSTGTGNVIDHNIFTNFGYAAIHKAYTTTSKFVNFTISNNEIYNTLPVSERQYYKGIWLESTTGISNIFNNKIHDLNVSFNTNPGTSIGVTAINTSNTAGDITNIYNNVISFEANANNPLQAWYGISVANAGTSNIHYNSIYIGGSSTNSAIARGIEKSASGTADVRNNVVYIARTGSTNSAISLAGTVTQSNNFTGNPGFVSTTTLQPDLTNPLTANLESMGIPVASITTDITGTPRNATTPDIGAYEIALSLCTNPTNGGTIAADQASCGAFDPAKIESTGLPSGETGTIEYKWQNSTISNSSGFGDIDMSNLVDYDPGLLTQTTWYKRLARVDCKLTWDGAAESNVVIKSVTPLPTGTLLASLNEICEGSSVDLTFSFTGTGPWNFTYTDGVNNFNETASTSPQVINVTPGNTTTYDLSSITDVGAGCINPSPTSGVTVTVNPLPVANDIIGTPIPCTGTLAVSYAVTTDNSATSNYFWSFDGTGATLNATTGNAITIDFANNATSGTLTVVENDNITGCSATNSIEIVVNQTPLADAPAPVNACGSYSLPALTNGNYFTAAGGTGTALFSGDPITSTQTIYVYTPATALCPAAENSFVVTIENTPLADAPAPVNACGSYSLPALTNGNYFTGLGGTGTALVAGDIISSTQTIYVYTAATALCPAAENSFVVTIENTPLADAPAPVNACGSYSLPALTNGNYYTGLGGTGTALFSGDPITSTQTIYVYTPATALCPAAENSFVVTIENTPLADAPAPVNACGSYSLPALTNGNYYTGLGGTGTALVAGDIISSTQTIYVYTAATALCPAAENSFVVTIENTPLADAPAPVNACGSYSLPALTNGNYFTGLGGTGTALVAGDIISSTQTIYVYTAATALCPAAENSFVVTIENTPLADAPAPVNACGSYSLPALTNGNYFTGLGGTGTALVAGDIISSTQTIYVYTAATALCPAAENSFVVTIENTPLADAPAPVNACGSYSLPALTNGNYFTGLGGTGTALVAGDIISSTQTIYVYTAATALCPAAENSFVVTIENTPLADAPAPVNACGSYSLPALTNGNYYTGLGGTGTALFSGDPITSTQTIYVYTPATALCPAAENSFVVTIENTPLADAPAPVNACGSYSLPALTNGNYFTAAGGTGTALFSGDPITSTQTIYVYTAATALCPAAENSFVVTIENTPLADAPAPVNACGSYALPALTNGNYFTGLGGTGTALVAGDIISSTQTIYVYTAATALCPAAENSFVVTIENTPLADAPAPVNACGSYSLPALTNGNYFTGLGGTGTALVAGDIISSTQTIYVYTAATALCPAAENSFVVTIENTPLADAPAPVNACGSYSLPALTNGNYYTGLGGTGTALFSGDPITSTQTIYVYTPATALCPAAENSFVVTIENTPLADAPAPVNACGSYSLPALTNGNYFTAAGGTGTALFSGDPITSTQTIYVYTAATALCPAAENSFVVTIENTPLADAPAPVNACGSYSLPALTNGNYYTGLGGTGTALFSGDPITSTQTIYVYTPATALCPAAENSFVVTIENTPLADAPAPVNACGSYSLPALTNGNYFTAAGGTGTALFSGDPITSTQTIYVYTAATALCPAAENSFVVTIENTPLADAPAPVNACGSYALPALTNGNYFTGLGGTGTALVAGDIISSTQTIYVYTAATALCPAAENSFVVTIENTPLADAPAPVNACGSYSLPALTNGNYFTGLGGTGTALVAGDIISSTQTIYVYTAATALCPAAENSFVVTIENTPLADAPAPVNACGSYSLPALTNGNYYTGLGGTGTALFSGDPITSTQTIYVYTPATALCPAAENSFVVTIENTPLADAPAPVNACGSYSLPALTNGNYFTAAGGTGTALFSGDPITSTQTIYVYTAATALCPAAENSFVVTIENTPLADAPAPVNACGSYALPALTNGNYFTGLGGTGTALVAGDIISSTQTIYVYTAATALCPAAENSFVVTIENTPLADAPAPVNACGSYSLPALTNGNYFTGLGGTGTALVAGDIISSTQTIYVYTAATALCPAAENSFVVTIENTPLADAPAPVNACGSYSLPALTNGNYYTGLGGTGTALFSGDPITSTQTIYVYTPATALCPAAENSFVVTIENTPLADAPAPVNACGSYSLPALTNGNYYTGLGGTGTALVAGDIISSTQTIYVYTAATALCPAAENSFVVTIENTPLADAPAPVNACGSYSLPALTNGNYFTGLGGTGTALVAGDIISSTQTIYVYTAATALCPAAENSFVVTIENTPLADAPAPVNACGSYSLPALTNGNYFTGLGGTGTALVAGDIISSTQTIYVYTAATALCPAAENSFVVTIENTPLADAPAPVNACGSYSLPALTNGNYYTGLGGTGTALVAGDIISSTQTIYVYTAATALCPAAENSFVVTINNNCNNTLGNTEVYAGTTTAANRRALPVTFNEDGSIESISIYHNGGAGHVLLGVYSDQSGSPSSLLGITASTLINQTAGWQTINLINPVGATAGQTVWLGWVFQNSPGVRYATGTPGRAQSSSTWSSGMPATFGASTISGIKFSIYCTYTAGATPFLTVSPASILLDHNSGGTGTFNITSNVSWGVTDDASWLDVTPSTGFNNGVFTVTANSANNGAISRTATITIAGIGVADKTVTVSQYPGLTATNTLGNTEVYAGTTTAANRRALPVTFNEDGSIESISIYHNGGAGHVLLGVYSDQSGSPSSLLGITASTLINQTAGWQTINLINPVGATAGQTVWLGWVFQNSPGVRYATGTPGRAQSSSTWSSGMPATFGASTISGIKFSIYCTYTAGATPFLTVSPASILLDHNSGGTGTFNITSNVSWGVTDDASWLDVTPSTGFNNGVFTVTANSANNGAISRTATITIAGIGVADKTVTVSQYPGLTATNTLGNTEVYAGTTTAANRRALPVTFNEDGSIESISIYHNGGAGHVLLGVYSDQSGSPSSLLGITASTLINQTAGWQTINLINPVGATAGQTVWLGWVFQNSPGVRYATGTPGRAQSSSTWSSGMPATFGASTISGIKFSIYCTYISNTIIAKSELPKSAEITTDVLTPQIVIADLKVYPNPFSDRLRFEFVSPETVNARIDLYDMTGRMVKTIFEQQVEGGVSYEAEFKPETIISGIYIYRVMLGESIHNGKVVFKKE